MKAFRQFPLVVLAVLLVVGCASAPSATDTPAEKQLYLTFWEGLQITNTVYEETTITVGDLYRAGSITRDQLIAYQVAATALDTAIDAAGRSYLTYLRGADAEQFLSDLATVTAKLAEVRQLYKTIREGQP